MSSTPSAVVAVPASVKTVEVPAKPLTAIQRIEAELANWMKQHEQAIANVHALEGAIQGGQHLLTVLKAEEAKAMAAAQQVDAGIKQEAEKIETSVVAEAEKVAGTVEGELKKI